MVKDTLANIWVPERPNELQVNNNLNATCLSNYVVCVIQNTQISKFMSVSKNRAIRTQRNIISGCEYLTRICFMLFHFTCALNTSNRCKNIRNDWNWKRRINFLYILMMLIYWTTCHAHLTLLELIIWTMFDEEHTIMKFFMHFLSSLLSHTPY